MKQFLTSILLSGILLTSCTTSIVNQRKPYADDKLKLGKNYTFTIQDDKKYNLEVSKIDSLNVYGKNKEGELMVLDKSQISTISKPNVGGTLGIIAGGIAAAIIIPAYISNKPVGN